MAHKKSTADRYYYLDNKLASSSRAADTLPTIMCTINKDDDENECVDNPENGKHMDTSVRHIEKAADNLPLTPRQHKFTEEEISKIENVFAEEIQAKSISMDTVVDKIKGDNLLNSLTPRRVYDKVRTTFKSSKASCSGKLELPEEAESMEDRVARLTNSVDPTLNDEVVPLSTSSRANGVFNDPKLFKLLKDGFKDVIKARSVRDELVQYAIKNHPAAKKLVDQLPNDTIKNRIKYEIRVARMKKS